MGTMRTYVEGFRTSPLQDRVWRTARLARSVVVLAISGALSPARIEAALRDAVDSHEILRTTFRAVPELDHPLQVIHESSHTVLRTTDLSQMDPSAQEAATAEILQAHQEAATDLAEPPVLRADLVTLSATTRRLVLSLPAMCADAGTLIALCQAVATGCGAAGPMADVPQYADVAEWIHEVLESAAGDEGRDYWAKVAQSCGPALASEAAGGVVAGRACRRMRMDAATTAAIDRAARDLGESTETFLLTCWRLLLWRAGGQQHRAMGLQQDGRTHTELAGAFGPLTRCLPLTEPLDPAKTFAELLRRTGEEVRDRGRWQEYFDPASFMRSAGMPQDAWIREVFSYADASTTWSADGTELSIAALEAAGETYGSRLACLRLPDGLAVELRGGVRSFDDDGLDGLVLERLRTLATDAARRPEAAVRSLRWLGTEERRTLAAFAVGQPLPEEPSQGTAGLFHHRFEAQVRRQPERTALRCGKQRVTYRELNDRADRFARRLRDAGAGHGDIVGLWTAPSTDLVVALLGVLKAGCAYLPIVPGESVNRASGILTDSRAVALVLDREAPPGLPGLPAGVIRIDRFDAATATATATDSAGPMVGARDAAYIIYTSGSTGAPKGVMVEHRSLTWFHQAMREVVPIRRSDRLLAGVLNAPLAFDASVQALLLLLEGHCLHLLPEETRRDPRLFVDYLRSHHIDFLHCTPTHLAALIEAGLLDDARPRPSLLLVAGEPLPTELWQRLRETGGVRAYNFYGPTECTVNASGCEITGTTDPSVIGRPLPGVSIQVLDPWLRSVGIGVPGEICVGGPGVARGYLSRRGMTAERFVPDPAARRQTASMYRTGDRGRFRADGTLEFLGRIDDQVKIRGFRVEPGEVEEALRRHPRVREAAVTARTDRRGGRYLVAYCVATDSGGVPSNDELRDFLAGDLPEFMIPATFTQLAALPTTAGGKLDRAALPEPDDGRPQLSVGYAAPRTEREEILAAVWGGVLGIERVGIDDNYFALGGDSIRSIQLRSQAAARGLNFSVQQLVEHPTIRALSEVLHERERSAGLPPTGPYTMVDAAARVRLPDDVEDAYPLSMMQAGTVYESESQAGPPVFHNVRSVRLRTAFDEAALRRALDDVVARHPILRTSFDLARFREPMQLVHRSVRIPLHVLDLRDVGPYEREAAVARYIEGEKHHRFDWSEPPFLRIAAHILGVDSCQLTFTLHEAIFDGWSVAVLLTEIFQRYRRVLEGADEAPKPLRSTYRDFVALERSALADEEARHFWAEHLRDATPTRLPRGWSGARPPAQHRTLRVALPPGTGLALAELARSLAVPLKSVLLAVHLRVLSAISGQDDVLSGVTVNGRCETEDGERVVGQFLNTVPFRLSVETGTWTDLITRVFRSEVAQLPHRRYPTAQIQREHGEGRLFDTAFNFTHFHVYRELSRLGGVTVDGGAFFDRTGLDLLADFSMDSETGEVNLVLNCNGLAEHQIAVIGRCYAEALTRVNAGPRTRHDVADLLAEEDRHRVLVEWNPTTATEQSERSEGAADDFVTLFERQARRNPRSSAVACSGRSLTYGELDDRATRLAHLLTAQGIGPDRLVALCGERDIPYLVAVIAVLKSGGAYLPLDPDATGERIAGTLRRLRPAAALRVGPVPEAAQAGLDAATAEFGIPLLTEQNANEAAEADEAADSPSPGVPSRALAHNLAVVLTTSGSTGTPKAVMLDHAGVANHLRAKAEELGLDGTSRVASTAQSTFVVSVWQMLAALTVGGSVEIIPNAPANQPGELLDRLRETGTTVVELVPTVLSSVVDLLETGPSQLPRLRRLVATGQALPERLARRWRDCQPDIPLMNAYGCTESSDDVAHHFVTEPSEHASSPIGRPARNTRIYVLDDRMRPVPPGSVGQICVSGTGLARGYHGDPRATAAAFVPDPFGTDERMYLTGDLGFHGPDGVLHCVGRRDRQVKVNGVRIEPAEVEAVLTRHPAVREAVVTAWPVGHGTARLTAYLVERPGRSASAAEYAAHLRRSLARSYIPSAFVTLAEIPVNRHGKVDHAALPEPSAPVRRDETAPTPVLTPVERELTGQWEELLPVDSVGPHDDFFGDLNGDSLLALQFVHWFETRYGFELPLPEFFDEPTIAATARLVEENRGADDHG